MLSLSPWKSNISFSPFSFISTRRSFRLMHPITSILWWSEKKYTFSDVRTMNLRCQLKISPSIFFWMYPCFKTELDFLEDIEASLFLLFRLGNYFFFLVCSLAMMLAVKKFYFECYSYSWILVILSSLGEDWSWMSFKEWLSSEEDDYWFCSFQLSLSKMGTSSLLSTMRLISS